MVDLNLTPGEWLSPLWKRISEKSSDGSSDEEKDDSDQSEQTEDNSDEWWYSDRKYNWLNGKEAIRMAPMASVGDTKTIEVKTYHQGNYKAAEVLAVYIEFALRDAWGDQYHVDVSVHGEPVIGIDESDDFFGWTGNHPDIVAKDCNLLVFNGGGYEMVGGGKTAVCQRAEAIDNLHGSPLYVTGNTRAHDNAATGMHEMMHCLGFAHGDGGTIDGAITPMGHYANNGDLYSFRLHPKEIKKGPDVQ